SSPGATLTNFGVGQIMVLSISASFLPDAVGELGIYLNGAFNSSTSLQDYVLWGGNGVRDSVAQTKGIWIDNDEIVITGIAAGETLQLKPGLPGNSAADYEIAPSTLGAEQVAAPVELAIKEVGFVDADTLFVEFLYTGSGTVKVTESGTLGPPFTDVAARTTVATPTPTRFEFDIVGSALFFRLEEE
ncbi:MAG: hypothetical protein HKN82_03030, partial [Akkermansiaceae bacterium]|nr:hypothetical protein [Akkermansiaceae bacterium]